MTTVVKICGIKTPQMATFCAKAGAQFIGIMLHPASPRYVNIDTAITIATAAKQAGIIPVAVFVDADQNEIINFCNSANIDHVQLHGDKSRQAFQYLPANIHKIYVVQNRVSPVIANTDPVIASLAKQSRFNNNDKDNLDCFATLPMTGEENNYLLFDSPNPGTGEKIDWTEIQPPKNLRFFLAGGLNASNVKEAIKITKPFAVDVSSGVESTIGEKSKLMITEFIKQVQERE